MSGKWDGAPVKVALGSEGILEVVIREPKFALVSSILLVCVRGPVR